MYFNSSFTNKDQRRKSALLKGYFGSFMQNYQLLVEDNVIYVHIYILKMTNAKQNLKNSINLQGPYSA